MDAGQAGPVLQDFHVDADVFFQLAVQGLIQGAGQVVVVHEVELVLANYDRNRVNPEIVMQPLRVFFVFRVI